MARTAALLTACIALPLALAGAPAFAAATHNLQNGTSTTNTDDTAATAAAKQDGTAAATTAPAPMTHKAMTKKHMKKHTM